MNVGQWLNAIGLGQYEAVFREHEIDAGVLRDLVESDLEKIGVPLGHRKRLLKAIASLGIAEAPAKPPSPAPASSSATAERRPITVMFCDLVGSTSLAARLDAEDWRTLVNTYLDEASAAVTALGGHVLKKLGDGLMALFGYPHAQENDGERAVRAALAIQRALVEINARNASSGVPELFARIGLDSGQVVVDATGEVFGDAPNIAARVQGAAEPGSILITGTVQRQTAGLFVAEDRGQHELKGMSAPMTLYRIVRASGGGRRGGARVLTPLVGREEELDLLARRWERARKGEGQLALIVGEPGLGKSRLMAEFHARLAETPHTWTEWSSSQLLQNTPLHPIAEWGRQRFGADLPTEQRLADLEHTLRLIGLDPTEYAPLLAPLVDVPLPEDRVAKLVPEELRRRQLAAMTAWILAAARTQAVVLAFEDLHWADPTSLDLMRALAERGVQAPLLVIATARPEFRPPWSVRSHHSAISLSPLDSAQIAKMVRELSSRHALPKDIVEGVTERTGGVPLFVEEVTRLLLERGEHGGAQAIPPTLQQSLAARLDRLGSARETAQIGAVLGRGFSYALLRDVAGLDEGSLRSALERLAEADILFVEGDGAQATYRFKHALIQDAAYDSLLKSRRQALHAQAAEILRESASPEPEAIAHHFTQAGLDDQAIEWWGKAGDQALRRSAFQEAIAHLGKAIAMVDKAGATARRSIGGSAVPNQRTTQLHVARANALIAARGFGAAETTEAFAKARESAAGDKDAPERLAAHYGLWVGNFVRGELSAMRAHAETFLGDVGPRPNSPEACIAHRCAGATCWFAGEYAQAREQLERAIALFQPGRDDDLAFRFGPDPGALAMHYLALTLWPMGDIGRAVSLVGRAEARIADLTHVGTLAPGRMHAAMFDLMRGDRARVAPSALELTRLAREFDLNPFRAFGVFLEGWASAPTEASGSGLEGMRRGVELLREQNVLWFDGLLKMALAEAEAQGGDPRRAVAILDEALATCDRTGYRAFEAELHRARGEMLLKRDADPASAEQALSRAIAVAREQGTRSFGLRAALSLAKLYQSNGRPVEAHAVLAPALDGFPPTPEMPEIGEAQALVAALAKIEPVREALEKRQVRAKMHLDYARAVQWAKGWGSEEARTAVERAHEFVAPTPGHPDYWSLAYGRFAVALLRGEFRAALEIAETYLQQAQVEGRPDHAVNARRLLGTVKLELGAFSESRQEFEKLLEDWDEDRDKGLRAVTGADVLCVGSAYMAQLMVILGEVDGAVRMSEGAIRRAESLGDFGSLAFASGLSLFVLAICGRNEATLRRAEAFAANASEKGARLWQSISREWASWARGLITGDAAGAATELRDIMAARRERQERQSAYMGNGLLAQLQGKAGVIDDALASIAEGLALAEPTGGHRADSFLHRVRGDVLAERDPAAAEAAYREALRIAQWQGARTFELQAAHALAKLHQSTGRPADAHAVLAPALEGFSPTPEMPEIAEAQALLAALAGTDEVKDAMARRQQLGQLQAAYGNALFAARGPGAPETTEAFVKARNSTDSNKDLPNRLAADYGVWAGNYVRGELSAMRAHVEVFLSDVDETPDSPEAGVAHRAAGITHWFAGEYNEARDHLEHALALFRPGRDDDLAFRFGSDAGVSAMIYLALTLWPMGDVGRAFSLVRNAEARIAGLAHINTRAYGKGHAAMFELVRGDLTSAAAHGVEVARLSREHDLPMWRTAVVFLEGLATAQSGAASSGLAVMRGSVELLRNQNIRNFDGLAKIVLAEAEARAGDVDRALAILDEALATSERIGHRTFDAELHRVRGEMLLKRDPANPAPAEAAFARAIEIAAKQGTRSFGLRAALALAKVYHAAGRDAEAHAVLAPALEGFAQTSEFPEIGEAVSFMAAIEARPDL
jgi:class 3 adenylate cyclase/tetratricopeptide (TPR) repeat protein